MKRLISTLLVLTMLVGMLPVFAVASNAEDVSITVDGDISDWAGVKSVSIVGSGDYAGKTATWYGVLKDDGLYLACDAYHDVYINNGPSWHESTNFEFFVKYPSQVQYWVTARDGITTGSNNGNYKITDYKMVTTELTDAETNYRTVTEVFLKNGSFPADAVVNGAVRVGFAWKTLTDLCNNGNSNGGNADPYWVPPHTTPTGEKKTYVTADGVYAIDEYEHTVSSFKSGSTALKGAASWGCWKTNDAGALVSGSNDSLFLVNNDTMTSGKITATFDRTSNTASHDGIVFGATGTDTYFWEGGARYYFLFFTGTEMVLAKTGNGLGWNTVKRASTANMWSANTITFSVEFNEEGEINCYVGDTLLISVVDNEPLSGGRYGVRSKLANIKWTSLTAEHSDEEITTAFDNEVELPIASWTGNPELALKGYATQGGDSKTNYGRGYTITEESAVSKSWHNVFVITNDAMPVTAKGSLSATLTGRTGATGENANANDNGIIFGLEATRNVAVWENIHWTAPYYFLYVTDGGKLSLAKVANGTSNWQALKSTENAIEGYTHGDAITVKAEFEPTDNGLLIKGYANGNLLIEYTDANPLTGARYGIRSEVNSVTYTSLVAEHEEAISRETIEYVSDEQLYVQFREGDKANTEDVRVIVVASEETLAAKDSCVFNLTFKYKVDGVETEKTVTKEVTKAYLEIIAKDNIGWTTVYSAPEGYAILGIVITGVPADAVLSGSASYN